MRIDWVDRYKGLLIILVVMGHVVGGAVHLTSGTSQTFLHRVYLVIYSFHMPAFFFLAGMMARAKEGESLGEYARKKARRLLVPYLVFGIASTIVFCLMAGSANASIRAAETTSYYQNIGAGTWKTCLIGLLHGGGWPQGEGFRMNTVLWFLPCMFSTMVVWRIVQGLRFKVFGMVAGAVAAVVVPRMWPELPWGFSKVPGYLLFVMMGEWWGKRGVEIFDKRVGTRFPTLALGVIGYVAGVCLLPDPWVAKVNVGWAIVFWLVAVVGCVLSMEIAKVLKGRWLAACGVASMGIMLMHKFPVLFLELKVPMVRQMVGAGIVGALVGSVLLVAVVTGICYSLTWMVKRWAPWALGERR